MIELTNIRFAWPDTPPVLDGVSLSVERGETVGLGPGLGRHQTVTLERYGRRAVDSTARGGAQWGTSPR